MIPQFRAAFPSSELSDDDIERLLLSAYLREGARGLDLNKIKNTAEKFFIRANFLRVMSKTNHIFKTGVAEPLLGETAVETIKIHFNSYIAALKHSLRIDFRSMQLSGQLLLPKGRSL